MVERGDGIIRVKKRFRSKHGRIDQEWFLTPFLLPFFSPPRAAEDSIEPRSGRRSRAVGRSGLFTLEDQQPSILLIKSLGSPKVAVAAEVDF